MKILLTLALSIIVTINSGALELQGPLVQGGWVTGKVSPDEHVFVGSDEIPTAADGAFVIGLNRQAKQLNLIVRAADGSQQNFTYVVGGREFPVQHITGVSNRKVNPYANDLPRIRQESAAIRTARQIHTATSVPALDCPPWPVSGTITGVYGSARTFNGEERSWHKGLDIAAPTGTPIIAPYPGKVQFAADTFFNGNLVILDHGQQIFTIYAHLAELGVRKGDTVQAADSIGTVGSTGRSTGPHLHWGLYWRQVALDPALLLSEERCSG